MTHSIAGGCRVTAGGAFLPMQLFLHQNPDGSPSPLGWGVRSTVAIAAGTFLSSFTGTVAVNSEVAAGSRYVISMDHFIDGGPAIRDCPDELPLVRYLSPTRPALASPTVSPLESAFPLCA